MDLMGRWFQEVGGESEAANWLTADRVQDAAPITFNVRKNEIIPLSHDEMPPWANRMANIQEAKTPQVGQGAEEL